MHNKVIAVLREGPFLLVEEGKLKPKDMHITGLEGLAGPRPSVTFKLNGKSYTVQAYQPDMRAKLLAFFARQNPEWFEARTHTTGGKSQQDTYPPIFMERLDKWMHDLTSHADQLRGVVPQAMYYVLLDSKQDIIGILDLDLETFPRHISHLTSSLAPATEALENSGRLSRILYEFLNPETKSPKPEAIPAGLVNAIHKAGITTSVGTVVGIPEPANDIWVTIAGPSFETTLKGHYHPFTAKKINGLVEAIATRHRTLYAQREMETDLHRHMETSLNATEFEQDFKKLFEQLDPYMLSEPGSSPNSHPTWKFEQNMKAEVDKLVTRLRAAYYDITAQQLHDAYYARENELRDAIKGILAKVLDASGRITPSVFFLNEADFAGLPEELNVTIGEIEALRIGIVLKSKFLTQDNAVLGKIFNDFRQEELTLNSYFLETTAFKNLPPQDREYILQQSQLEAQKLDGILLPRPENEKQYRHFINAPDMIDRINSADLTPPQKEKLIALWQKSHDMKNTLLRELKLTVPEALKDLVTAGIENYFPASEKARIISHVVDGIIHGRSDVEIAKLEWGLSVALVHDMRRRLDPASTAQLFWLNASAMASQLKFARAMATFSSDTGSLLATSIEQKPTVLMENHLARLWDANYESRVSMTREAWILYRNNLRRMLESVYTSIHKPQVAFGIDGAHSGQGLGLALLQLVVAMLTVEGTADTIYAFKNEGSNKPLQRAGFRETDRTRDGDEDGITHKKLLPDHTYWRGLSQP